MVILYAVIVFSLIVLALTAVLLVARRKLVPQGEVKITVNGDTEKPLLVQPGSSLLTVLSDQNIFLPSACGGGGTCAMCECHITAGGGDVLPTELNHLTRREVAEHKRLACQVKVRGDMDVQIPEEIFGIKKFDCTVKSNYNVATFIKEFVVQLPEGEDMDFESGGYIQIDVPKVTVDFKNFNVDAHPDHHDVMDKYKADWDKFKMWDLKMVNSEEQFRAYSMANHPGEGDIIMLNIRIATPPFDRKKGGWMDVNPGVCSSYVFDQEVGDKVVISGPYGEFFIKPTEKEMVYIGGGAGMAPLRSHIFHLFHSMKTDRKVSYWYGGRSKAELFYGKDFAEIEEEFPNFSYHVALSEPLESDNWDGLTGYIHQAVLDNYLKDHEEPEEIEYYLCGPPMMLSAVQTMLDDLGVPEENIAFDDFGS
ncbi:NADH:ubiquinone reductase (Na(+)-transporting) subunit F [Neolewinella antarctica]|uniref:Na(+)-translocating NADH-quinone reductase subunit F n=1 Tax=Neolewinella antarctica TaxID=442734 RepID=A0ABX0XDI7_9BACT|nr:NADH:ubiquinone reductase (Na(+)-transporting) subunit F [Neolewinella antarctica]NJC27277.1 Na+-transporting NADH:ubiquinone oxidoreductase subunit F [Neolewinella antarctica]